MSVTVARPSPGPARRRRFAGALGRAVVGCGALGIVAACTAADRTDDVGAPVASAVSSSPSDGVVAVDWGDATYLSVCGLSGVEVIDGRGVLDVDGRSYGVAVVDAATGDLDGDGREDAAVLVDCLGGPEPYPHVVVVTADGVSADGAGTTTLAPFSGGSVGYGERPMWIEVRPGGTLAVRTDQDTYELRHAPGVLLGGELDTPGPATYQGTLRSVSGGIMTLSLTADDGYRIPVPDGLVVVDVRSGSGVPVSDLVDEDLSVFVDAGGVAATVQHLPRGPG